jgi:hypothetical protein
LLTREKQLRHKDYRFASDGVAQASENTAGLTPVSPFTNSINHPDLTGIKIARTCYDHFAGKIRVQLTHSFLKNK